MKLMRTTCALWLILLFAACIPASPPANVSAPPGESAIITQNSYANDVFSVGYPTGWRVITSPAGAPPSVTFVAPGDCGLVIVSSAPLTDVPTSPSCNADPYFTVDKREITLGDQMITIAASAPDAEWTGVHDQMDRVATSLKAAS